MVKREGFFLPRRVVISGRCGNEREIWSNMTEINKARRKQEVTLRRGMSRAVCRVARKDLPTVSMQLPLQPVARTVAGRKEKEREVGKKGGVVSTR